MGNTANNNTIDCRGCIFEENEIHIETDLIKKINCTECKFKKTNIYINKSGSISNLNTGSQSIPVDNQLPLLPLPPIPSHRPLISNISTSPSKRPLVPNNNINNYNNNNHNKQHINFGYNNNEYPPLSSSPTPPPRNENDNENEEEKKQSILLTSLSVQNENDNENREKKQQSPYNENNNQEGYNNNEYPPLSSSPTPPPRNENDNENEEEKKQSILLTSLSVQNENDNENREKKQQSPYNENNNQEGKPQTINNNNNNGNNDNDNNYIQHHQKVNLHTIMMDLFRTGSKDKIKNIIINDIRIIKKEIIKTQKILLILKKKIDQITNISRIRIQINPSRPNPLYKNPINKLFDGNDDLMVLFNIGLPMFNDGSEVESQPECDTVWGTLDTYRDYALRVQKLWTFRLSDYYKICNDSLIEIDANLRIRYTNVNDSNQQKIYTKFTIKVKTLYNNVKNNHKNY